MDNPKFKKLAATLFIVAAALIGSFSTNSNIISAKGPDSKLVLSEATIVNKSPKSNTSKDKNSSIKQNGAYTKKADVALYIHTYNKLPKNFMTKKKAKSLGWTGGGLDDYAYGYCIGGDYYGNYEGALPEKKGRVYHECDIDTLHKSKRGAKRIIYSNDGLIYYTEDHYETFTLLYGEE